MMKLIVFTIALSYLLSPYNVEATSRTLTGQVAPALEEICSKTGCSKECSSTLAKFIEPGNNNIDANAALLAGLKALDAETTKAITEAEKLSNEKPRGKAAEEITVGMAVYYVVSNSTKKAQEAIQANKKSVLKKEIKLASKVTGDLLDTFQEGVVGKNEVMKDINVYIHQLTQNNFKILGMAMKTQKKDQANQHKEEKEKEKEDEDEDEDEDEEEEEDEHDGEEELEEDSAPTTAPAPVSFPKPQPPK